MLFNAHGTAPGMWFEQNGKVVVSLPGVPFEMEHLMTDEVMPRLKARFSLRQIVHRTLITAGLAESMLAEKIADWENALPPYLHLAYLPAPGVVRLRLSAYEVEGESVSHEIDRQFHNTLASPLKVRSKLDSAVIVVAVRRTDTHSLNLIYATNLVDDNLQSLNRSVDISLNIVAIALSLDSSSGLDVATAVNNTEN